MCKLGWERAGFLDCDVSGVEGLGEAREDVRIHLDQASLTLLPRSLSLLPVWGKGYYSHTREEGCERRGLDVMNRAGERGAGSLVRSSRPAREGLRRWVKATTTT